MLVGGGVTFGGGATATGVEVGATDGTAVGVGVGVTLGVGVGVGVGLGTGVLMRHPFASVHGGDVTTGLGEGEGSGDGDALGDGDGSSLGDGLGDGDAHCVTSKLPPSMSLPLESRNWNVYDPAAIGNVLSPSWVNGPKSWSPGSTTAVQPIVVAANVTCSHAGTVTWCASVTDAPARAMESVAIRTRTVRAMRFMLLLSLTGAERPCSWPDILLYEPVPDDACARHALASATIVGMFFAAVMYACASGSLSLTGPLRRAPMRSFWMVPMFARSLTAAMHSADGVET